MKIVLLALVLFLSANSIAEIYGDNDEKHLAVVDCRASPPFEYKQDIYLDRSSFLSAVTIESVVDDLLLKDLDARKAAYSWEPPKDLHPTEGARYALKIEEYLSSSYAKMAECVVNNHQNGYVIRRFSNKNISPSKQEGYVVLDQGRIVARVILSAVYAN